MHLSEIQSKDDWNQHLFNLFNMRRLPLFFLIDVSESMVGEPIEWVQDGMATMIVTIRRCMALAKEILT